MPSRAIVRLLPALAVATMLGGCVTLWGKEPAVVDAAAPAGPSYQPVPFTEEEFERLSRDEADLRDDLADVTTLVDGGRSGRMVEYTMADGRAFLWAPGARDVLVGQWKIEPASRPAKVHVRTEKGVDLREMPISNLCLRYQSSATSPAAGIASGGWSCRLFTEAAKTRLESRGGDIFRLAERAAVPYPLSPEKTSLGALLSRCGDC